MIFYWRRCDRFEEDAWLTAMWLWTLSTPPSPETVPANAAYEEEGRRKDEEDEGATNEDQGRGFVLEFDAARKIAQGLGAHLEQLASLIEVRIDRAPPAGRGANARAVSEGWMHRIAIGHGKREKKRATSFPWGLSTDLEDAEASDGWGETGAPHKGETVLDRVHQSMILFGAGRSEALKRFLVDDGAGRDERFWRLAQASPRSIHPRRTRSVGSMACSRVRKALGF